MPAACCRQPHTCAVATDSYSIALGCALPPDAITPHRALPVGDAEQRRPRPQCVLLHRTLLQRPRLPLLHKLHAAACAVLCGTSQEIFQQPACSWRRANPRGGSVAVPRAHDVLLCSGCVPPERAFPTAHPPTLLHCALCVAQPEGTSSVAVAAPCRCAHTCTSNCMRPQWRGSRTWTMRYSQLRGCGRVQLSTHCAALRASVVAPCPSTVSSASAAAAGLVRCLAPGQ